MGIKYEEYESIYEYTIKVKYIREYIEKIEKQFNFFEISENV